MHVPDATTVHAKVSYDPGPERLVFVGLTGPGTGVEFPLLCASSILGRGPGASLILDDPQASRRHLKLVVIPDPVRPARRAVLLQDLDSTNGVKVNGRTVTKRVLQGGEKILVGRTVLRFERRDSFDAAFYGRLQQLATTDPLTGVGNRLAMAQEMERQEAERIRYGRAFSVLLVDLDHFKKVNDRWGHSAGDHVLREVAAVILSRLRDSDRVFRFGGEEFLAMLPETAREAATTAAERIRVAVADAVIRFEGHPIRVSVSIGGAEATGDDVLGRADRALYLAKRAGRNCVRTAPMRRRSV